MLSLDIYINAIGCNSHRYRFKPYLSHTIYVYYNAWMIFSGEVCRLQICSGITTEWFDSTFRANIIYFIFFIYCILDKLKISENHTSLNQLGTSKTMCSFSNWIMDIITWQSLLDIEIIIVFCITKCIVK